MSRVAMDDEREPLILGVEPVRTPPKIEIKPGSSVSKRLRREEEEDREKVERRGGGIFSIRNVGGSLIPLLGLAVFTWCIREARRRWAKHKEERQREAQQTARSPPPYATLSPPAVAMLVELNPSPHTIIDLRSRDKARAQPSPFANAINIPESELRTALQLPRAAWEHRFGFAQQPSKQQLLLFISAHGRKAQQGATTGAQLGYNRSCVLAGGLEAYALRSQSRHPPRYINRDALALLLHRGHVPTSRAPDRAYASPQGSGALANGYHGGGEDQNGVGGGEPLRVPKLVDVRRFDERSMFGFIQGSLHLPVDQLPRALEMDDDSWQAAFHFPKLKQDDVVIFLCRACVRSDWAYQMAVDAGYSRCFVYRQGAYGWRLDKSVEAYDGYREGDAPPTPVRFEVESVDMHAAERELIQLGLF